MINKRILISIGFLIAVVAVFSFVFGIVISSSFRLTNNVNAETITKTDVNTLNPFVDVVKNARGAVVSIKGERTEYISSPWDDLFRNDPFFRRFFGMPEERKYKYKREWLGSGFIVDIEGKQYIFTNNHVISGAQKLEITLDDGEIIDEKEIEVVGSDNTTDVGLIRIKGSKRYPSLKIGDSDKLEVGEWVIAIGSPFGLRGTVTVGVVSAKGRSNIPLGSVVIEDFIQTDAAINPGNSGGPMLNIYGEVVGINTAIVNTTNIGIGFAIPINLALQVANELIKGGKISRGYLGVYLQELTDDLKEELGIDKKTTGVIIAEVEPNSPAERSGIEPGDVIIKIEGKNIKDVADARNTIASYPAGKKIEIEIIREKKLIKKIVKLGERNEISSIEENKDEWLGMKVSEITKDIERDYNLRPKEKGLIVIEVKEDSPAFDSGIEVGDIIKRIGRIELNTINDFLKAKDAYENDKTILFYVKKSDGVIRIISVRK
uniref:Do family serine endopeptidase n=1 Tax=candidate division WOR-3 bacterium TaxID=2052148 RepID=A0A7C4UHL3_UNCW3